MMRLKNILFSLVLVTLAFSTLSAQAPHGHDVPQTPIAPATEQHVTPHNTADTTHGSVAHDAGGHDACHPAEENTEAYDPVPNVMHHIGDAHQFHIIGDLHLPLPVFAYDTERGLTSGLSSMFHHGAKAVNGFVLAHDVVRKAKDLPMGEVELDEIHDGHYSFVKEETNDKGAKEDAYYVKYKGTCYKLEESRKLTNSSSWIDFSVTKNVFTMLMAFGLLAFIFFKVAKSYAVNAGKAPTGLANLMEVFVTFIRDEVAKPSIGAKYEKYTPFLMSLFFFILFNNLFGLIPFAPFGANVMGNISSTIVLAVIVFLVVNFSGNKHYWQHIFWMPDVPVFIKVLMLPVEIASLFIKPVTLLVRLFANITAGHVVIATFVSLIFVFGNAGKSVGGSLGGALIAVPFTAFMNILEILVAFLQAFIFTLLSALYIGSAIEEHHHADEHH
jgi:F-type H+-transporting ATPase subunit a